MVAPREEALRSMERWFGSADQFHDGEVGREEVQSSQKPWMRREGMMEGEVFMEVEGGMVVLVVVAPRL